MGRGDHTRLKRQRLNPGAARVDSNQWETLWEEGAIEGELQPLPTNFPQACGCFCLCMCSETPGKPGESSCWKDEISAAAWFFERVGVQVLLS